MISNFFFSENRVVYEIMWKATVEPDGMTYVHCMSDAEGYKHKRRICNTSRFSTATVVARRCLNVTLYVNCLSCSAREGEIFRTEWHQELACNDFNFNVLCYSQMFLVRSVLICLLVCMVTAVMRCMNAS